MSSFEMNYKNLLLSALDSEFKEGRNGNTKYLFGQDLTHNLQHGFPIVTSKKIFFKKAYHEYRWFVEGLTTTNYLKQNGIHWWDDFADSNGNLGKTYGYQLRSFNGEVDQLESLHWNLSTQPNSRRMHVTLWNPSEINETKLPPCYTGFTFSHCNNKLNMIMHFRSSDLFLGLPYDMCVGALFLTDIARFHNMTPNLIKFDIADAHIYMNHEEQIKKYISLPTYKLPYYNPETKLLDDYQHGPFIEAKLNV